MNKLRVLVLAGVIVSIPACSAESLKRTGYETLQNIQETQCEKDLSAECPERESYEAYQRKIKENNSAE